MENEEMDSSRYELTYWGMTDEDVSATQLMRREVLLPSETKMAMTTTNIRPASYYRFIVCDGEELFIAADCVVQLKQVFSGGLRRHSCEAHGNSD